ncbi:MAG TPA: hypothetical protein VKU41_06425 [Polyangiaceae bacterium]|nr:hypothetical protein [Polyangiaceae bacterium]
MKAWLKSVPTDPTDLVEFVEEANELKLALEAEALMRLRYAEMYGLASRTVLWSARDGDALLCWRADKSLLFLSETKVHSWSRFRSLTGGVTEKHLPTSTNRSASKFNAGVDIHALEHAVVAGGRGYVNGARQIMMFGRFAENVGTAVSGSARTPTAIVQVHLDLRNRPKCRRTNAAGTVVRRACGTFVEVHGYPITEAELNAGFAASAGQVLRNRLPNPEDAAANDKADLALAHDGTFRALGRTGSYPRSSGAPEPRRQNTKPLRRGGAACEPKLSWYVLVARAGFEPTTFGL